MGLYDTVYIEKQIFEENYITCPRCGQFPKDFQTKSFSSCMESYYLKHDEGEQIRLFKLDDPTDKRFWHEYTKEEIEERDRQDLNCGWGLRDKDGYWNAEAWLPENRVQRNMGELPHQYVRIYTFCPYCKDAKQTWMEYELKFTDGIVTLIKHIKKEGI